MSTTRHHDQTGLATFDPPIQFGNVTLKESPFRYAGISACLKQNVADALLDWFETTAPWQLVEMDFYEQFEFSLLDVDTPASRLLMSPKALADTRREMSILFGCEFSSEVNLVAHKLMPGQRIAIHNDFLPGQETHRLTVQLNRGLHDDDGGFFMLFNSDNAEDVHEVHRPEHLSALAFEISDRSFHAVSRMHSNLRYTLVYSFFRSE